MTSATVLTAHAEIFAAPQRSFSVQDRAMVTADSGGRVGNAAGNMILFINF